MRVHRGHPTSTSKDRRGRQYSQMKIPSSMEARIFCRDPSICPSGVASRVAFVRTNLELTGGNFELAPSNFKLPGPNVELVPANFELPATNFKLPPANFELAVTNLELAGVI